MRVNKQIVISKNQINLRGLKTIINFGTHNIQEVQGCMVNTTVPCQLLVT